jgi:hypothetical protein
VDMMRSAWLKWARAVDHAQELAAETRRYGVTTNHEYVHTDNASDYTNPLVCRDWRLRVLNPIPERWSLLVGDVVANLRDALDHAFWAAAVHHSGVPARPTQVAFPIYTSETKFIREARKRLSSLVAPEVWEIVELVQPYHDSSRAHIDPLEVLRFLSNVDKHRAVHIVENVQVSLGPVLLHCDPPIEVVHEWVREGPANDGDVLARIKFRRPTTTGSIDMLPVFTHATVLQVCDEPREHLRLHIAMEVTKDRTFGVLAAISEALGADPPDDLEMGDHFALIHPEAGGHDLLVRHTDLSGTTTIHPLNLPEHRAENR